VSEQVLSVHHRAASYPNVITDLPSSLSPSADYARTPAGIQRNVELASVLEPLVYSPNKTTRITDCNPDQRLAFFLTAGVNIGESFRELGERLVQARVNGNEQPLLTSPSMLRLKANANEMAAEQTKGL
jgi:hypothetical protein